MPLKSNIGKIRAGLNKAVATGNYRAAGFVADLAAQLAPEDEGDLKRSIKVVTEESDLQQVVTAGEGLPDPRAIMNEYGGITINYPAQPYMTPAARAIKPEQEVVAEVVALYRSNAL